MEQFLFDLRNLPLKRLVTDALGEIELMAAAGDHGSDFVTLRGTSAHVGSESRFANQPRILC
jgi:hypothetical protein